MGTGFQVVPPLRRNRPPPGHPGEIAGDFDRAAMEFIIAAILGFAGKRGNALPPVVGRAEFEDGAVPGAITGAEQDAPVADADIAAETFPLTDTLRAT